MSYPPRPIPIDVTELAENLCAAWVVSVKGKKSVDNEKGWLAQYTEPIGNFWLLAAKRLCDCLASSSHLDAIAIWKLVTDWSPEFRCRAVSGRWMRLKQSPHLAETLCAA